MSRGDSEAFEAFIAEARRARGEAQGGAEHAGATETFLRFRLGEHEYAIAGAQIREVIPAQPITRLPGAPSHILGVVLHRRDVIGVLDLERWLERSPRGRAFESQGITRMILIEHGDLVAAIATHGATEIVAIPEAQLELAVRRSAAAHRDEPYLRAVVELESGPIVVLHVTKILSEAASAGQEGGS